jgi:hypothetical protein
LSGKNQHYREVVKKDPARLVALFADLWLLTVSEAFIPSGTKSGWTEVVLFLREHPGQRRSFFGF